MCMKLSDDVRYELYGDHVYLRRIGARKDYLFNATAKTILDAVRAGCEDIDRICMRIREEYAVEDVVQLRQDIAAFVELLCEHRILVRAEPPQETSMIPELLHDLWTAKNVLASISIELTHRCDERCIHCYVDRKHRSASDELTEDELRSVLDQARAMGAIRLLLTGGEVTCRDRFTEIARYASEIGFLVDIYTNGLSMTDEVFDRVVASRPNSMSFSLYGGSAAVHDAITCVPGSFERTLRMIMMTKCAGIDTCIKTVAMRDGLDDLQRLYALGKRIGVPVVTSHTLLDKADGSSNEALRLCSVAEHRHLMELAGEESPREAACRSDADHVCNCGLTSLSIDPYGNILPCLSVPIRLGNVRTERLSDVWNGSAVLQRIRAVRFADVCARQCEHRDYCAICLGTCGIPGIDFKGVHPSVCMIAEAQHILTERKGSR